MWSEKWYLQCRILEFRPFGGHRRGSKPSGFSVWKSHQNQGYELLRWDEPAFLDPQKRPMKVEGKSTMRRFTPSIGRWMGKIQDQWIWGNFGGFSHWIFRQSQGRATVRRKGEMNFRRFRWPHLSAVCWLTCHNLHKLSSSIDLQCEAP